MKDVTIILTPVDAEMFKTFQKYHEIFVKLIESGVFDVQFGKCVMNIAFGQVQNIVKEEIVYKR